MFIHNKYCLCYFNIVTRAKARVLSADIYVERHHIIPKSLGGTNDATNIVKLTAREHLICHRLLIHMTYGLAKSKMANAAWRMMFSSKNHKRSIIDSRTYESIRSHVAEATRERNMSRKHTEETKRKISESKLGKTRNITPEWRQKIIDTQTGMTKKPLSDATKQKISQAKFGKKLGPLSDEHRKRVSDSKKGKKIQVDPITGRRYYQTLE